MKKDIVVFGFLFLVFAALACWAFARKTAACEARGGVVISRGDCVRKDVVL